MTRANFVKKARKDNPVVKKGESYWWWEFRFGGKHYSATKPRSSQLTQSEFYSQYYSIQETLADALERATYVSEVEEAIEDAKSELENLRDETQDKFDSMPDQLQYSETGELLEERIQGCDEFICNLEEIDIVREEEMPSPSAEITERQQDGQTQWAVADKYSGEILSDWFDDEEVAQEVLLDEEGEEQDTDLETLKEQVLSADPSI